jgi:hypothetical protein
LDLGLIFRELSLEEAMDLSQDRLLLDLNTVHSQEDSLTGDQPVARLLPAHRTTQTQIRTHDPSVRTVEEVSCIRQHFHCDRFSSKYHPY